ncbi:FAD-dependent monooxygenase [Tropicimonas sp. S265A]|uniref:FAD-dependent monooxygenase n=1 Tax=Tropicimonas sp. S265A TaxID=3415134 RepID=UPI003C7B6E29
MTFEYKPYDFIPPPGLANPEPRKPVVIVGAGPIGLAMAIELANHDQPSVILDDNNVVSVGSRAICWSKRSLEIFERLGIADRALAKGVTWQVGRTFHRDKEVFSYDLLPEDGHKMPAFINLQQYYVEQFLIERAQRSALIDLRFSNKVTNVDNSTNGVILDIETPDGAYALEADYVLACDGARSPVRGMLGLEFEGEFFEERFLIADIEMDADFPPERHFWFEPKFHEGQSALLHKQPDNIYRIDLQLGWHANPDHEMKPEVVIPRIIKVVGHSNFRLDWVSVYSFQCRRLASFVHDRVIFVGDSAHVVSPFGARGGNGGMQDVDNLGWKLAAILKGHGSAALLDTYNTERVQGADENIANSARATKFMTPADGIERLFRDQVLVLAGHAEFARHWVNAGRLSKPCTYRLEAPDDPRLPDGARPGAVAPDAPLGLDWLTSLLGGEPVILALGRDAPALSGVRVLQPEISRTLRKRYLGEEDGAFYLVRPDQVIGARWVDAHADEIANAVADLWAGVTCR